MWRARRASTNLIWRYVVELLERSTGGTEESYCEKEGEDSSNGKGENEYCWEVERDRIRGWESNVVGRTLGVEEGDNNDGR